MNKLKVGLFVDAFFPTYNGVVNYVNNLARELKDRCEVTLFCPGSEPDEFYQQFPYQIVRCKHKRMLGLPYEIPIPNQDQDFLKKLAQSHFDLVHIHSPFGVGKVGYRYALKNNIPIITTFHTQFKKDLYRHTKSLILTNILLRNIIYWVDKSDEIWTNNQAMIDLLTNKYRSKVKKKIMPNFTDHQTLKHEERKKLRYDFNEHYNVYERTKLLLFVGRLTKLKNPFFLVKTAKILKKMNFQFKMIFVGDGIDEQKIRTKVRKNHLENYVLFLGKLEATELMKIYAIADLLVFPSKYDTSSLVQIEAAMQFLPTLFLSGTVTASAVTNNLTGFTSKDDPYDYALKILEIFHSKQLYNNVREHCHALARSWEQVKDAIYTGYLEVIKNHVKKLR